MKKWPFTFGEKAGLKIYVVILLSLIISPISAQTTVDWCASPPPAAAKGGFTLKATRGCVPFMVEISSVKTGVENAQYIYEYTGGDPATLPASAKTGDKFYTYTKPGKYRILQVGSGGGAATGTVFCQEVEVLANPVIMFTAKVCSNRMVVLDIALDSLTRKYDQLAVSWGDGTPVDPPRPINDIGTLRHQYAGTGSSSYSIAVMGIYNGVNCGGRNTLPVRVTSAANETRPIVNSLVVRDDKTITLQYQASNNMQVTLYQKDASGNYKSTGQSSTTGSGIFTVQTDAKQVQCFQLVSSDPCGSMLKSEEVCSMVLSVTPANKQNATAWEPYKGTGSFTNYRLLRNGTPISTITNKNTTAYTDDNRLECNVQYCYAVEAIVSNTSVGPTTVVSAPVCVTGVNGDAPGVIRGTVVSVEDGQPRLVITPPNIGNTATFSMFISRADTPNGSFQALGEAKNTNVFQDITARTSEQSYCYQVVYQNSCGLKSAPSQPVCTVLLTSKSNESIDWNAESPFAPGSVAFYTVEILDTLNQTRSQVNLGSNTYYEPDLSNPNLQALKFRIIANAANGTISYSNFYEFRQNAKIFVPTAFTPNGDGNNDIFAVKGMFWDRFILTVYNRWGEPVYNTTNKQEGWDGTINGQEAPAGNYVYRIEMQDLTGQRTVKSGAVMLLR